MAQAHFDKNVDLRKEYEPLLYQLSKDSEIVMYAEAWMDYELESLDFLSKEYWSKVKTHLHSLAEN